MMLEGIVVKAAGILTAGAIQASGRKLRDALKKPEKQKAVQRCARAGLEALLEAGTPEDEDTRRHVASVLETFFDYPRPQTVVADVLRGRDVDRDHMAELFAEECPGLEDFDADAGFAAFLEVFERQLDHEPELRDVLRTGLDRRKTAALEELPTKLVHEQRRARKDDQAEQARSARAAYLARMRDLWSALPLAPLGGRSGQEEDITLDQVYIDLDTTTRVEKEDEPETARQQRLFDERENRLPALQAAGREARLVLLGDPGAGKSTFVRELLVRLARAQSGEAVGLPAGIDASLLPVLLVLQNVARKLADLELNEAEEGRDTTDRKIADAVLDAALESLEVEEFRQGFLEAWRSGRCLLVLDGLDEVPRELRGMGRRAVEAVHRRRRFDRMVVTCRVRSYHGDAELPGFTAHTLAPFHQGQIQDFCKAWYRALGRLGRVDRKKAAGQGEDLAQKAVLPEHRELAENPMLLTTMALVHHQEMELPRERVRLYDKAVEILLWRWQRHKGEQAQAPPSEELAELLADELQLHRILQRLAAMAQETGGEEEGAAGLHRKDVLGLLVQEEYLKHEGIGVELLDYVDRRTGILVGQGGTSELPERYGFPHRTFQEYLAGRYLMSSRRRKNEVYQRAAEGDLWSVAVEMGIEALYFVQGLRDEVADLAYGLRREPAETEQDQRALLWSAKAAALLGVEYVASDTEGLQEGPEYLEQIRPGLVELLDSRLPALERAEAGRALARLEDPRGEVLDVDSMELCWVPAGVFWLGTEENEAKKAEFEVWMKEWPQRKQPLSHGYWISRFPITQTQYGQFVDAGGYGVDRYWQEAEAADHRPEKPAEVPEPFSLPNHPVVAVSWYEALAFCRWLEERWREAGWLPEGWRVTLPSEPEWEKAARGGLEIPREPVWRQVGEGVAELSLELVENPESKRPWPWRSESAAAVGELANCRESGIEATSAAGCFSAGRSPYGCEDMVGNVWEWTRSAYGDYPYPADGTRKDLAEKGALRVLRGGAFFDSQGALRCAYRGRDFPQYPLRNFGFRVVCAPFLESL